MSDELARLRAELNRVRQGYQNILEFRAISGTDRYGALTREEIEGVIAEIDAALSTPPAGEQADNARMVMEVDRLTRELAKAQAELHPPPVDTPPATT